MNQSANEQRDLYVAKTLAGLSPFLSSIEIEETRREMTEHLSALASAHRELGKSEEEAITLAILDFGRTSEIQRAFKEQIVSRCSASSRLFMMICTSVIGTELLMITDSWMTHQGLVSKSEPELSAIFGLALGICIGLTESLKAGSLLHAVKRGLFCALVPVSILSILSILLGHVSMPYRYPLMVGMLMLPSGAITGLMAGWLRTRLTTNNPPKVGRA